MMDSTCVTPAVVLVMGPSGSGKSTLGASLARVLGAKFIEADDFCPDAARVKMTRGVPLQDEDRWPWLARLNREAREAKVPRVVLACSAHKESYRRVLRDGIPQFSVICLEAPIEVLRARMLARPGHFMPVSLLPSQIALIERPVDGLVLDASQPVEALLERAEAYLRGRSPAGASEVFVDRLRPARGEGNRR